MSGLKQLQEELVARQDDLSTCKEMLQLDPDSTDALETIPILEADIADIRSRIAELKATQNAAPPPPPPSADPASPPPKYDMSKHPKFRKQSPEPLAPQPDEAPLVFQVKDVVMAKWTEDKQWYQATIVSKTGSSTDPVYKVTFKGYGNTETKRKNEVRALETSKKRKADGAPALSSTAIPPPPPPQQMPTPNSPNLIAPPPQNGAVISAAPAVDVSLKVQKREPSRVGDGPTRMAPEPKKLKGNKVLDKAKNSWQSWQQSGPKKAAAAAPQKMGKESQFRTPDLPNARVGFTGSGKPMQKDQARSKWEYGGKARGEDDE